MPSIPARILIFGLAGLGMGLVAGILVNSSQMDPTPIGADESQVQRIGPIVGSQAPDFSLEGIDDRVYQLTDFRGSPVLLNFWATWCAPCRVEMPAIEGQFVDKADRGFMVLAINNDEPRKDVQAFSEELGLTFPLLLDPEGQVQQLYRVLAYPTSVFIDATGVIQAIHFGVMTEGQIDDYLTQLGLRD